MVEKSIEKNPFDVAMCGHVLSLAKRVDQAIFHRDLTPRVIVEPNKITQIGFDPPSTIPTEVGRYTSRGKKVEPESEEFGNLADAVDWVVCQVLDGHDVFVELDGKTRDLQSKWPVLVIALGEESENDNPLKSFQRGLVLGLELKLAFIPWSAFKAVLSDINLVLRLWPIKELDW